MTREELEQLILALPPADAAQLVRVVLSKLHSTSGDAAVGVEESASLHNLDEGTHVMEADLQVLLERLTHLSPKRQAEVGGFIDFLHQRELAQLTGKEHAQPAEEDAFPKIWDNDDDALYDKL